MKNLKAAFRVPLLASVLLLVLFSTVAAAPAGAGPRAQVPLILPESALTVVLGMAVIANRFTDWWFTPLFERYKLDKFFLMYVAWMVAGLLTWLTQANVFAEIMSSQLAGMILTAIFAGGGANLLHDLSDAKVQINYFGPPGQIEGIDPAPLDSDETG